MLCKHFPRSHEGGQRASLSPGQTACPGFRVRIYRRLAERKKKEGKIEREKNAQRAGYKAQMWGKTQPFP